MKANVILSVILLCMGFTQAQNSITMVIAGDDEVSSSQLTAAEKALHDTVTDMNIGSVALLCSSKVSGHDFSSSDLVIACDNIIPSGFADDLLQSGVNVIMLHRAVFSLGGQWQQAWSSRELYPLSSEDVLSGYGESVAYKVTIGNYYYTTGSFDNWRHPAVTGSHKSNRPLFVSQYSGVSGLAMGYDPSVLTAYGWDIFKRAVKKALGIPFTEPAVVPDGHTALVIQALDDTTPVLNANEQMLKDTLQTMGHSVYCVSSSRSEITDFSKAAMVAAGSDALGRGKADSLINHGTPVLLFGNALNSLAPCSTLTTYTLPELVVDSSVAFLEGYPVGGRYDCAKDTFWYCSPGWSTIATAHSRKTAFRTENSHARGAAIGYGPANMKPYGWEIGKRMIRWVQNQNVIDSLRVPSGDIAFVVQNSESALMYDERCVSDLLSTLGEDKITFVPSVQSNVTDYREAKMVIASRTVLSSGLPQQLIDAGISVVLFGDALRSIGGSWESNDQRNGLQVSNTETFMQGYLTYASYSLYNENTIYPLADPENWTPYAHQMIGTTKRNILFATERGSAKGAAFGMIPDTYSDFGIDIIKRMLLWVLNREVVEPVTVPSGHIAFPIHDPDDQTPRLNSNDLGLSNFLDSMGHSQITYISTSRMAVSDVSDAKLIVVTDKWMSREMYDSLQAMGKNILVLGDGLYTFSPDNYLNYGTSVVISSPEEYFEGISRSLSIDCGKVNGLPLSSDNQLQNVTGTTERLNIEYNSAFYETKNNGRSAVFGLVPEITTTADGWEIVRRMIEWCLGEKFVSPREIKENSIGFVVSDPNDTTPVLNYIETMLRDTLVSMGYSDITYISKFRTGISDFSRTKLAVATEIVLGKQHLDSLLQSGTPAVMFYEGLYALPGEYHTYPYSSFQMLKILSPHQFLKGYSADLVYQACYGKKVYTESADSLMGKWNIMVCDSASSDILTTFSYEKNDTRGAAFGFSPDQFTPFAWDITKRMVRWAMKEEFVEPVAIPEGNVAFVIHDLDENGVELTSAESSMRDTLLSMGQNKITYVPSSKVGVTDFSPAQFVLTHLPVYTKGGPDSLLNAGVSTLLLGQALSFLPGTWKSQKTSDYLKPSYAEAYLSDFVAYNTYKCATGLQYYPPEPGNAIDGWTFLGRDAPASSMGRRIAFSTERENARGAAVGYAPEGLTQIGWDLFRCMVRWVTDQPISIVTPQNMQTLSTSSVYAIEWDARESIDSVVIEFSSDNGSTFQTVATVPNTGSFEWQTPDIVSTACVLKITDYSDPLNSAQISFALSLPVSTYFNRLNTELTSVDYNSGRIEFTYSLSQTSSVEASVYSLSGKRVGYLQKKNVAPGAYSASLQLNSIAGGLYIMDTRLGTLRQRSRVVVTGATR